MGGGNWPAYADVHWDASRRVWSPYVTKRRPWPWWTRHGRKVKWTVGTLFVASTTSVLYHAISRFIYNFRIMHTMGYPRDLGAWFKWKELYGEKKWTFWSKE